METLHLQCVWHIRKTQDKIYKEQGLNFNVQIVA